MPKPKNIWFPALKLQEHLPPTEHILIGAFQVLDKRVEDGPRDTTTQLEKRLKRLVSSKLEDRNSEGVSYVDFGFGDNKGTFSGINRFAVESEQGKARRSDAAGEDTNMHAGTRKDATRTVRLSFSAVACNPSVNEMTISNWILAAHKIYVKFLFREAVARVLVDC